MSLYVLINIIIFLVLMAILYVCKRNILILHLEYIRRVNYGFSFSFFLLRTLYTSNIEIINKTIIWYNIVGNGYVRLL